MSEALKILQEFRENKRYSYMYDRIDTAIEEVLAKPEQEPVAWIDAGCLKSLRATTGYALRFLTNDVDNLKPTDVPLYLAPPTREPLSDEEIGTHTPFHYHEAEQKAFKAGVKWAEAQHKIGAEL